jgi:signal transduction histidine kinase
VIARITSLLWPKSLYRQILLVAALALFVAQAINAALLINSARNRAAGEAATLLISRITVQAERQEERGTTWGEEPQQRNRSQRSRLQRNRLRHSPAIAIDVNNERLSLRGFDLEKDFTARADEFLSQTEYGLTEIRVYSGPVENLPQSLTEGPMKSRFIQRLRRSGQPMPSEAILFVGKTSNGKWISAASFVRDRERGSIIAMLLQTLTLYVAVMIPLAWVAGRIAKPLERLTERVGRVGLTDEVSPLESEGPADIRNLVDSFNIMQARVSSLLGEKDVMLGAIGHDLKTPLAALRVRVESVEDDEEREKMVASIDEMVIILDDILTLARLGKSGEALQRTDIGALLESVVDEFAGTGDAATFEEGHARILATIRPVLLRRALRNLIGNALKHGGSAAVSAAEGTSGIIIKIADNGPGIPPEKMEDMFAPFARMESSRNRATGGSGLGLTIARAIAKAHGGDVRLENRMEGGLTALLLLPGERAIS